MPEDTFQIRKSHLKGSTPYKNAFELEGPSTCVTGLWIHFSLGLLRLRSGLMKSPGCRYWYYLHFLLFWHSLLIILRSPDSNRITSLLHRQDIEDVEGRVHSEVEGGLLALPGPVLVHRVRRRRTAKEGRPRGYARLLLPAASR